MNIQKPTVYTIATSHLDTSWNWTFERTLNDYLPKTLRDNFRLFKNYPDYTFSFEGAYRYELFEEYYPELFEDLKKYIAEGRWNVAGSSYENGDTNIPSPEALFRNILYGNGYFKEKFGKISADIFLPDCFGFGYALPSVAHHCGLLGFTTQKLTWSSFAGVPFDLGKWYGVDGNCIYGAFDASNYNHSYKRGVRKSYIAPNKLRSNVRKFSLPYTVNFHGTGDRGGAPAEISVKKVSEDIKANNKHSYNVESVSSDKIFYTLDSLPDYIKNRLPVYKGELVSTDHGAGGYTSRTASKRLNRRCEQLGESAERASLMALCLTGAKYNSDVLKTSWKRVIAHQFHDDITGTSIMECYKRNWNDYFISLSQFLEEYRAATERIAGMLDTSFVKGKAVCVINTLQYDRTQTVCIDAPGEYLSVFDGDNNEVFTSVTEENGKRKLYFSATVPAMGAAVFDLRTDKPLIRAFGFADESTVENEKLRVSIDVNGDVCSIYNKQLKKELLSEPVRLQLYDYDGSIAWPAWELSYKDISAPVSEYPALVSKKVVSAAGAILSVEVIKRARGSEFKTVISLDEGSDVLKFYNEVEWYSECTLLKAGFSFTSGGDALYDLGLGAIKRGNNTPKRFEVPAQMWAAVPDKKCGFTVSAFSDSRVGWDKPSDNTLRLTCIHSPKSRYRDVSRQDLLDFGINRFSFAVYANSGKISEIQRNALCFNQPMGVFSTDIHKGSERKISFAGLSTEGVILRSLKLSENGEYIAVRFNEGEGRERMGVEFSLAPGIAFASEADGCENVLGDATVRDGKLIFDIGKYGVKTFLLKTKVKINEAANESRELSIPFDFLCTSPNSQKISGELTRGYTFPAEQFNDITCGGIHFSLSSDKNNACTCRGNVISLGKNAKTLYLLAASVAGDKSAEFIIGGKKASVTVADMYENIGAWDMPAAGETGYVKKVTVAKCFTHMHGENFDMRGKNAYICMYSFDCDGASKLTLPEDDSIILFGAAVTEKCRSEGLSECFDSLERRTIDFKITPELEKRHEISKKEQRKGSYKFKKGFAVRQLDREIKMRF